MFSTHLNGWLIKMSKIRCSLAWFLTKHHSLWVDKTEGINDHLSLHTLYWIHHHSHSTLIQCFKALQKIKGVRQYCIWVNNRMNINCQSPWPPLSDHAKQQQSFYSRVSPITVQYPLRTVKLFYAAEDSILVDESGINKNAVHKHKHDLD